MVENRKRGPGRPRSFNEDEALDRAIGIFWKQGFDATSLDDLSDAMRLGRPSIYGAFGDKRALFLRVLRRYTETVPAVPMRAFDEAETIQEAVAAWLCGTVDYASCDPDHLGCLLGHVAATVDDAAVRALIGECIAATHAKIAVRLAAAVDAGELPPDFRVDRGARRAINAMLSLTARARVGTPVDELLEDAADSTAVVLSVV